MSEIEMVKGDTTVFDVIVTRLNSTTGLDEVVNLTGAKAWFTAKHTSKDTDIEAVIAKDSVINPSQVTITAVQGKVRITIAPGDTSGIDGKFFEYDVQIKEADGTVTTVQRGRLILNKNVTISTA